MTPADRMRNEFMKSYFSAGITCYEPCNVNKIHGHSLQKLPYFSKNPGTNEVNIKGSLISTSTLQDLC